MCNLAIERRATVRLGARGEFSDAELATRDALVAAALQRAGRQALHAVVASDFPIGAGLGGSSAAGVALAAALAAMHGATPSASSLAEESRAVEVEELGIAGGRQDHYAAAYGGALGLTFGETTAVERIPLSAPAIAALEARITLVYSGESRLSAETITAVLDAYATRVPAVVAALDRMAVLARGMRAALHASDISTLAALVDEHWVHQKSLHPRITTPRIDAIERAARGAGATGFKACGASGGGCVLVISSAELAPRVRAAIGELGEVLPWRVAMDGVRITE